MDSYLNTAEQPTASTDDVTPRYISDEAGLGQRLNNAVHQQQRADFGYLLAMLSDNVLEHSASALRKQVSPAPEWHPPFAFGPAVPLAASDDDYAYTPGETFQQSRAAWRLHYALRPEGLNPVNDAKFISPHVRQNCAHFVQSRMHNTAQSEAGSANADASEQSMFNPENLVDIIDSLRGVDRAVA